MYLLTSSVEDTGLVKARVVMGDWVILAAATAAAISIWEERAAAAATWLLKLRYWAWAICCCMAWAIRAAWDMGSAVTAAPAVNGFEVTLGEDWDSLVFELVDMFILSEEFLVVGGEGALACLFVSTVFTVTVVPAGIFLVSDSAFLDAS